MRRIGLVGQVRGLGFGEQLLLLGIEARGERQVDVLRLALLDRERFLGVRLGARELGLRQKRARQRVQRRGSGGCGLRLVMQLNRRLGGGDGLCGVLGGEFLCCERRSVGGIGRTSSAFTASVVVLT